MHPRASSYIPVATSDTSVKNDEILLRTKFVCHRVNWSAGETTVSHAVKSE
ncbi:hypothetical protein A2U01_0066492, partial [Trifolium medium]|nr:hypothetical protein [Trifolium medium]